MFTAHHITYLYVRTYCRNALRVAEGIVLLLGHVASEFGEEHGAISCVVALFQQRLFTPVSNLDGRMVVELGKIAASLGVSIHACYNYMYVCTSTCRSYCMHICVHVAYVRMYTIGG